MSDPRNRYDPDYDPWQNPDNTVAQWTDSDGQINQKIVSGPDEGLHRYYDPANNYRTGQTGYDRPYREDS
jgi:hypothetical protein